MLIEEYPYNENPNLIRHYSDENFIIRQIETGNEYGEAIDLYPCKYTYVESENPLEKDPTEDETNS